MSDIKDDPLRTAGPGELWSDRELEDEEDTYDPDSDAEAAFERYQSECFRGREAAAFEAAQMDWIQRNLK